MSIFFNMPKLGHLMEEGTVVTWHKKEGEIVTKGEILLEVETDKTTLEVESSVTGRIVKLLADESDVMAVNEPLVELEEI